jgi:hypothetical protein
MFEISISIFALTFLGLALFLAVIVLVALAADHPLLDRYRSTYMEGLEQKVKGYRHDGK